MGFLLGTEKAKVEMPSKVVFEDVSLGVDAGDRIGIVGANGDGKSTLLRLLSGAIEPDTGRLIRTNGVRIGILRQSDALDDGATVIESVVGDRPEYEWASDPSVRDVLDGLLGDIGFDACIGSLSGGQRRRVDLARVLAQDWDVVMLDEPTNHLDMATITWLAGHVRTRWKTGQGALLAVSHDRWFLDEVCNAMWEVHDGRVDAFEGGFSAYVMQRVERQRQAMVAEQKRQNLLRRELAWLSRGARARATKPKFHVAAARELIADVPELRNPPELKRMAMARIGKDVVDLQGVSVSFDDDAPVLDDVDWIIGPGDRIGIVGANGAGKTTLLNVVRGALAPTSGRVKIGSTVRFAMLSQRLESLAEFDRDRVRELVARYSRRRMASGKEMTPSQLLEDLGFGAADLNEYIGDLSGGQRRRLALMMILMEESNVLILDEPGNDLDVDMLAALEDLLDDWPGTLLLVTHDRNLMERVTDDQYALLNGTLRHLPGGVDEYLRLVAASERESAAAEKASAGVRGADGGTSQADTGTTAVPPAAKLSNSERQQLKKLLASHEKKMATAEMKVAALRAETQRVDPSDYEALMAHQTQIAELEARIAQLESEWLEASEALGE